MIPRVSGFVTSQDYQRAMSSKASICLAVSAAADTEFEIKRRSTQAPLHTVSRGGAASHAIEQAPSAATLELPLPPLKYDLLSSPPWHARPLPQPQQYRSSRIQVPCPLKPRPRQL